MIEDKVHDMERRIQVLEAAIQYMAMPSKQLEVTTENKTANVLLEQVGGVRANVVLHQNYGFWSRPLKDAMHTVLNVGGSSGRGISIASNDERYRPINLLQGDVYIGDNTKQYVWITHGDTINIVTNGTVNITAPTKVLITCPDVEMTGNLTVHGDILDETGTSNADNVKGMRDKYNAHTHGGVQGGSARTTIPDHTQ